MMTCDKTFDIGSDTRTGVDNKLPFRFTGKIDKLTFKLGPSQMVAAAAVKPVAAEAITKATNLSHDFAHTAGGLKRPPAF